MKDLMSALTRTMTPVTQTLEQAVNRGLDRSVRLAVTGLRRSGKTVFITSLIHQLMYGADSHKLPFFSVANSGRLCGTRRQFSKDMHIPSFRYDTSIEGLTADPPYWPINTNSIGEIRLSIRYKSNGNFLSKLSPINTLYLDIIDYPGEWLLDLPLLNQSFEEWSKYIGKLCEQEPRLSLSQPWRELLNEIDPGAEADERDLRKAAHIYTEFLNRCKEPEHGLTLLQPGRFTMPGELAGAPLLEFCPLPRQPKNKGPYTFYAEMERRYEAYKERVVKKFYNEYFSGFDRQIVLVDVLQAFNNGHESYADMREALSLVLRSFSYGSSNIFKRLFNFNSKIDKLLFAATKADHVTPNQLPNLEFFLQKMLAEVENGTFKGVTTSTMALASLQCTEPVMTEFQGQKISCIKGMLKEGDKPVALFPGEVPVEVPSPEDWIDGRFHFMEFRPPRLANIETTGLPHIRMDRALEFLLGDKF